MEVWKQVSQCSDLEVSSLARVRVKERVRSGMRKDGKLSVQRRKAQIIRPWLANNGYLYVCTKNGPVTHKFTLHRLVAIAFVPGYRPELSVNHIDGNKLNNATANLEWCTLAENTAHQWKIGLINLRGENHPSSKLTDADVRSIRSAISSGTRVVEIAERFSVSSALIYKIRSGQKRIHS